MKTEKAEKTNKKQKHFWKDFKAELKKVIWPTKSQVINNTIIVIAIVIIVTAIVFILDLAFEALNTYGIDKLKTMVQNSVVSEENNNETDNNSNNDSQNTNNESQNNGDTQNNSTDNSEEANDVTNVENVSE